MVLTSILARAHKVFPLTTCVELSRCVTPLQCISYYLSVFLHELPILALNQNFDKRCATAWTVASKVVVQAIPLHRMV